MINILIIVLSYVIKALISISIVYAFKSLYNFCKGGIINFNISTNKKYSGDFFILATKISYATLSSYYFVSCFCSVYKKINIIDLNMVLEVVALFSILSLIPFLFIYFVINDLRNNIIN